jgi:hypothetical protein
MHDLFRILGVSPAADVREIRRASHRRVGAGHPDVQDGDRPGRRPTARRREPGASADVALDFLDMGAIVIRMRADFFSTF